MSFLRIEVYRDGEWINLGEQEHWTLFLQAGVAPRLRNKVGKDMPPPWRVWQDGNLVGRRGPRSLTLGSVLSAGTDPP